MLLLTTCFISHSSRWYICWILGGNWVDYCSMDEGLQSAGCCTLATVASLWGSICLLPASTVDCLMDEMWKKVLWSKEVPCWIPASCNIMIWQTKPTLCADTGQLKCLKKYCVHSLFSLDAKLVSCIGFFFTNKPQRVKPHRSLLPTSSPTKN